MKIIAAMTSNDNDTYKQLLKNLAFKQETRKGILLNRSELLYNTIKFIKKSDNLYVSCRFLF